VNELALDALKALGGAVLWPALHGSCIFARYVYRRARTSYPLEGRWHAYSKTIQAGELKSVHREWLIQKGINYKYRGWIMEKGKKVYRLSVVEEEGNFVFSAKSVNGGETFQVRARSTFYDREQSVFGLHVASHFDRKVFVGVHILSRKALSGERLDEVMHRNYRLYANRFLIEVDPASTSTGRR
jgi:hypothetical protein